MVAFMLMSVLYLDVLVLSSPPQNFLLWCMLLIIGDQLCIVA